MEGNINDEYARAFLKSPRLTEVERRARLIGWRIVFTRDNGIGTLRLVHYTGRYTVDYGPAFGLSRTEDIDYWIGRCEERLAEFERTKWGQYPGWENDYKK